MSVIKKGYVPKAIFADAQQLTKEYGVKDDLSKDYEYVRLFLLSYSHSKDTYNTYRREVERYCQWVWYIEGKSVKDIDRHIFLSYIKFFEHPPQNWVATQHYPRFVEEGVPNDDWRPFVVKVGGVRQVGQSAMKSMFACLSTFYTFLMQEEWVEQNPIARLNQKKKIVGSMQCARIKRRLTSKQWSYVINVAESKADDNDYYERHLYILALFFLLGVRISEIAQMEEKYKPMNLFYQDHENRWWFEAHGKGGKTRDVAVPDDMLLSLERFRGSILLCGLPSPADTTPLVPKYKGRGGLGARQIRALVAEAFGWAVDAFRQDGLAEDAYMLQQATVHWLRHTAISEDVAHRPSEHVRDDVGHENIATTSLYIDTQDEQRHASAKSKRLKSE